MTVYIQNKKYSVLQEPIIHNQDITIIENGNYYPSDNYTGFNLVRVKVPVPVFEEITIEPKIIPQIYIPQDFDGYDKITVNPVTSSIDSNIKPENIKKGINILGINGTVEFITEDIEISPTKQVQTFIPTADGFYNIKVEAVTSSIDTNIKAENIRKDINILGVIGTLIESNETTRDIYENGHYIPIAPYTGFSEVDVDVKAVLEELTISPSTSEQIFNSIDAYHGFSPVKVKAVTSNIDENIKAENIRKDINILGTTGNLIELLGETRNETLSSKNGNTYTPSSEKNAITEITILPNNKDKTITPTINEQIISIDDGYSGNGVITVNAISSEIDSNLIPANIKNGITIFGVEGTCTESKTTTISIIENGTYTPQNPYNGFSSVDVNINTVNNTDITITEDGIYTPPEPYTGFETVTVDIKSHLTEKTVIPTATTTVLIPENDEIGFSKVTIDLSWIEEALQDLNAGDAETTAHLQDKTVTAAGIYTADSGYDGLGTVTVNLDWVDNAIAQAKTEAADGNLDKLLSNTAVSISTDADIIKNYAFYYNTELKKVILNQAQSIGDYAFANSGLVTLIINTMSVCTLNNTNAFTNVPNIYVPDNLVNSYKTAVNWSNFASKIHSINTL